MLMFGHCFRACALTSAFMVIGSSFFHQVQAQTLPDQLISDYGNCVGIELGDVDGRPIFFFDGSLQALPAPSEIELQGGIAAGNCLADATGDLWAYDPRRKQFSTNFWHQRALNAQSEALVEQGRSEVAAQLAEFRANIERAEEERRAGVWSATIDACKALYRDDVVAALTNQICQPLFLEVGLPSDGQ